MAKLTAADRNRLGPDMFALPKERKYPIHDINHARDALARASGKPEEATVRKAVMKKYPQIDANEKNEDPKEEASETKKQEAAEQKKGK